MFSNHATKLARFIEQERKTYVATLKLGIKTSSADTEGEVIETKEGRSSIVLLMHDSNDKPQTVESLPDIIQMFKDEGYTFKTFYEIF